MIVFNNRKMTLTSKRGRDEREEKERAGREEDRRRERERKNFLNFFSSKSNPESDGQIIEFPP